MRPSTLQFVVLTGAAIIVVLIVLSIASGKSVDEGCFPNSLLVC